METIGHLMSFYKIEIHQMSSPVVRTGLIKSVVLMRI